jgi:hypothetical protein
MLEPSELRQFFPVIVTPSHDGKYFQNYVMSMMNFAIEAERAGMRLQVLFHQGESLVTRARNNCVAQFLANPQWTHLFWIDADIGFSAQAAFRLLLADYDIAAGVYPLKREDWPAEGVAEGTTRQLFEATFTRYTVNAKASEASFAGRARGAARRFHEDDRGADGFHGHQARGVRAAHRQLPRAQLRARQHRRARPRAALPLLRRDGRSADAPLPVGRLRFLPPVVGPGRVDLHRRQLEPHAPGRQALPGRLREFAADLAAPRGGRAGRRGHGAERPGST